MKGNGMAFEMNDAERQAEEILKAEADRIQTEECPMGLECGVHHRVDESTLDEGSEYARYISYVGEYVVVTDDNFDLYGSPTALLSLIFGIKSDEPRWETVVYRVNEGTLSGLTMDNIAERRKYRFTHNDWDAVKEMHELTVLGVREGMIDLDGDN